MKLNDRFKSFCNWFAETSLVKLCDSLSKLVIIIAVATWLIGFLPHEVEKRKQERIEYLWRVVLSASGKSAEAGRLNALEALNDLGVNLNGVNLSNAVLFSFPTPNASKEEYAGLNLSGANMVGANFNGSIIAWADLSNSVLWHATFHCTQMNTANLDGAYVAEADFRYAQGLTCPQLKQAIGWEQSYRDDCLKCGEEIPGYKESELKKRNFAEEPPDCLPDEDCLDE